MGHVDVTQQFRVPIFLTIDTRELKTLATSWTQSRRPVKMVALLLNLSTTPTVACPAISIMAASIRIHASAPCLLLRPNLHQVSIAFFSETTRRLVSYVGRKYYSMTSSGPLYQHALLVTHTTILLAVIAATSRAVSTRNLASVLTVTMLYQLYQL